MDLHRPVEGNKSYDLMTPEEKLRYDHQKMHEMHRGHDSMHMKMVLILIGTLVVAQIIVVEWKKFHYRSYAFFTMVAMWSIPLLISTYNHSTRFIIVWTIFTLLTSLVIWKSSQKPMSNTTPRMVYKWFYLIYKVSCFFMLFGYVVMVLTFLSVNVVFNHRPQAWMDVALMCMFYGVYFGVLGRDVAEYCTDKMAASIGDIFAVILARVQPASWRNLEHFGKIAITDVFTAWEDGLWGRVKPYNLANVRIPVSLLYGDNDKLTEKNQIMRLAEQLNATGMLEEVGPACRWPKFNHLDFVYAKDLGSLLTKPLVRYIKMLFNKYGPE